MDTRSRLPDAPLFGGWRCVHCMAAAPSSDHAPPRCLLRPPLPANVLTLPACIACNASFSFDENVVRAFLTLVSAHPDLVAERAPGGRLERALARDMRLRGIIERSLQPYGSYCLTDELRYSIDRVFRKTVLGLFFGLYDRLVDPNSLRLLRIVNSRLMSAEKIAGELRPPPFEDITDKPVSEISPRSWHSREQVIVKQMQPAGGGPLMNRLIRLKRGAPIEWTDFQPGIFRFTFVKRYGAGAACIFELWKTLIVAIATPWPDGRGPVRRGKKNPLSRDR